MSWTAGTGGTRCAHLDTQLSDVQPLIEVSLSGGIGHPGASPPRQQGKQNVRGPEHQGKTWNRGGEILQPLLMCFKNLVLILFGFTRYMVTSVGGK